MGGLHDPTMGGLHRAAIDMQEIRIRLVTRGDVPFDNDYSHTISYCNPQNKEQDTH